MDHRVLRAQARASLPVCVLRLGEIDLDVRELTGRALPTYDRSSIPVRVVGLPDDA